MSIHQLMQLREKFAHSFDMDELIERSVSS